MWWRVHRHHQHNPSDSNDQWGADPAVANRALVDALARLYAYVYGVPEADVSVAAEQRAAAMDISDRWVNDGREPASPLIAEERAALIRSYAALLAAVHRV